jgi:hypothetical protein
MSISSNDELIIRPVLLVKDERNLSFDQATLAGWEGVQFRPCQPDHPDKAGYGVFTAEKGRPGEFRSCFIRLNDAVAEIEADQN